MNKSLLNNKPIQDAALNIVATLVSLAFLQLVVLPAMANSMSTSAYAAVVTMLSVFNLFPGTLGTTLNNIRLVYRSKYEREEGFGDFQILLIAACLLSSALIVFAAVLYGFATLETCILLVAVGFCWIAREYYCVEFRLNLTYKKVLWSNVLLSVGYIIGFFVFRITGIWEFVYLFGQFASLLYVLGNTGICKEPLKKSELFNELCLESTELAASNILSRGLAYADRLLLYPMLGSAAVAVYYVSTLAGKLLSTAISPISSVVLSYLARRNEKPINAFRKSMTICILLCIVTYAIIQVAAPSILKVLYSKYAADAVNYLGIASLSSLTYVLISVASPFTLRYYAMKWQTTINAAGLLLYIILGYFLASSYGLMGFCVATLISNLVKLALLVGLFSFIESDTKV